MEIPDKPPLSPKELLILRELRKRSLSQYSRYLQTLPPEQRKRYHHQVSASPGIYTPDKPKHKRAPPPLKMKSHWGAGFATGVMTTGYLAWLLMMYKEKHNVLPPSQLVKELYPGFQWLLKDDGSSLDYIHCTPQQMLCTPEIRHYLGIDSLSHIHFKPTAIIDPNSAVLQIYYPIPPPSRRYFNLIFWLWPLDGVFIRLLSAVLVTYLPREIMHTGYHFQQKEFPRYFHWITNWNANLYDVQTHVPNLPYTWTPSHWTIDLLHRSYKEATACGDRYPFTDVGAQTKFITSKWLAGLYLSFWIPDLKRSFDLGLDEVWAWQHGELMTSYPEDFVPNQEFWRCSELEIILRNEKPSDYAPPTHAIMQASKLTDYIGSP